jgi:hypothetical protein
VTKERYPLNAPGPFYVGNGECISCRAPEHVAPTLMGYERSKDGSTGHCYFKKQPASSEETGKAILAVKHACCAALRYSGNDPDILKQLEPYECDPPPEP